jgi:transglutaminase 1
MIGQLDDYTANGVSDAEDIISQYKNKEGTEDERMSVLNAARCGGLGFLFEQPAPGKEDVEFELFDIDKVILGDPFLVTVRIMNKSPMRRTISLASSASSVYYTGILAQKVKRDRQNIVLNGLQEQLVRVRVNPEDYMERLVDYSMMKIYAIATVKETQQTWSKEDDFMIEKPLVRR